MEIINIETVKETLSGNFESIALYIAREVVQDRKILNQNKVDAGCDECYDLAEPTKISYGDLMDYFFNLSVQADELAESGFVVGENLEILKSFSEYADNYDEYDKNEDKIKALVDRFIVTETECEHERMNPYDGR